jgi:hypothetical protein
VEIPNHHKENFEIWKTDPMTQWYLEQIDKERNEIQVLMGQGFTVNPESVENTAMETAKNFGKVNGLDFCTTFEIEEGEEE